MRRQILTWLGAVMVAGGAFGAQVAPATEPKVQLAILLDTSNSMDGLIDQARTQLWSIVNEFARLRRDGRAPRLEVALYEYGNDLLPASEQYLRMVVPLTSDLDRVSEQLFALKTNGGSEYCGAVIRAASDSLAWSQGSSDFKAIFVAGNEEFTQGTVDYHASCAAAVARGIVVNTIFCGPRAEGERTGWKNGADLADGRFVTIDQNRIAAEVAAPQDAEIARLGQTLNTTYVPFGQGGHEGKARQEAQDGNARAAAPSSFVQRQVSKSQPIYANDSWDLVDAVKGGSVKVEKVRDEDLPAEMKAMSPAERKVYVDKKAGDRAAIQAQIRTLSDERAKFLAAARAKESGSPATLDKAIVEMVGTEAAAKGYSAGK
jgi:hypothetical protein